MIKEAGRVLETEVVAAWRKTLNKSYIHHGLVAHRHKFPSCQSELPVGCRDNETHSALKLDWSSNPVYSPGSMFHTLNLEQSTWNYAIYATDLIM
jgi:hypothetical protein